MSISDKIQRLRTAKSNIAAAITAKGGIVDGRDGFEEFADDIGTISAGANLDDFIAGRMTEVTSNLEAIPDFAFSAKGELVTVNLPEANYIGKFAFSSAAGAVSGSGSGGESSEGSEGDMNFNNRKLVTVNMPKVTNIETSAFQGDENLEITSLPSTLLVIQEKAFKDCPKVQLTSLNSELTYIGDNEALPPQENFPFNDVTTNMIYIGSGFTFEQIRTYIDQHATIENNVLDLTNVLPAWVGVNLSDSITNRQSIFGVVSQIKEIIFPDSVTNIGDYAFSDCGALTTLTIPNSVTSIGAQAFRSCEALTTLTLGNSVTNIGDYAFSDCGALTTLTIPNSVTSIGNFVFVNCSALTTLTLGNSVNSIGKQAFIGCQALTTLTIPDSVTSIDDYAFYYCIALTTLTLPDSITSLGNDTFGGCNALTTLTLPDSITSIGDSTFNDCRALTTLTLPDSITSLGDYTFGGCNALTTLTLPDSITSLGDSTFNGCNALTTIDMTAFDGSAVPYLASSNAFYADTHAVGFKFVFATQEALNAFANETNWSDLAQYFEVQA